jgi:hypothetical protein
MYDFGARKIEGFALRQRRVFSGRDEFKIHLSKITTSERPNENESEQTHGKEIS